uniref:Cytochrome c oxidase subunit 3 n=1 Tax=Ishiharodelphax matsuyamensis TaxID=871437 RepID=A0A7S4YZ61_9HEMI|nr:cytochrome c oxidase subunit III [Ishiharodelphax matsuyamensis]QBZ38022.1 cytochrome c oxidase subunit III [Ishiharodelphax matsuyamensis]
MKKNHPFHLVTQSPWPILTSFALMNLLVSSVNLMNNKELWMTIFSSTILIMNVYQWWRDIKRESSIKGDHTIIVKKMIKMGMILFIISEIMFFLSFFWSFFHASLAPSVEIGLKWPPKGIQPFNPMEIPLLNTIVLLSSGASITWAHQSMISMKLKQTILSMFITIGLGTYFSILQWWEYKNATFTIADSIFGSTFFLTTGFHGIHVIIGTTFIIVALNSIQTLKSNKINHLSLELSSWYWHFVDVVWLFLYLVIYWWNK